MLQISAKRNLTLIMDFYELTMAAGYFEEGYTEKISVFDMFFRRVPDGGGFAIAAGLEQLCELIDNLEFTKDDIEYLRAKKIFSEKFLNYLENFKFTCNVWAIPEGTPIFPHEPILIVEGPAIEAQLIETLLLVTINFQSLIATKTSRVVRAAQGRKILEFGSRRAQGYDAAYLGARAAYIAGAIGTSCVMAERYFDIPVLGTMAHSWVQMFNSEYDAFASYARTYPDNCTLLVDTYSVVNSGVPNAIKVFNDVLKPLGKRPTGIRIDSGDIAYLSKKARKLLDEAGYEDCTICASNSLDEYIIRDLILQGAQIDVFGIGENLITSKSDPVFGGVYKLAAIKEKGGEYIPKIKISETAEKTTIPHLKNVYRIYDNTSGQAMADYITLKSEELDESLENGIELFHPTDTWKKRNFTNVHAKRLNKLIYKNGKKVYEMPSLNEIREHCQFEISRLWDEVKRFEYPHKYYVDLSLKLWEEKQALLHKHCAFKR